MSVSLLTAVAFAFCVFNVCCADESSEFPESLEFLSFSRFSRLNLIFEFPFHSLLFGIMLRCNAPLSDWSFVTCFRRVSFSCRAVLACALTLSNLSFSSSKVVTGTLLSIVACAFGGILCMLLIFRVYTFITLVEQACK